MTGSLRALAALTLLTGCQSGSADSDTTIIRNVTVIDLETGAVRPGLSVLIRAGLIADLAPNVEAPRGARTIDGANRFLIPGLWDMHAHLVPSGRAALPLFIRFGVTGVRDAGGQLDSIDQWRREIEAGRMSGPRIVAAGLVLESGPWLERLPKIDSLVESHGVPKLSFPFGIDRRPIRDTASARAAVDSAVAHGGTFVKGRTWLDSTTFSVIARRARERGVDFIGHAPPREVPWRAASEAGMTGIEHMGGAYASALGPLGAEARGETFAALSRSPTFLDPNVAGEAVRGMTDAAIAAVLADTAGVTHPAMLATTPRLLEIFRRDFAIRKLEHQLGAPTDAAAAYRREVELLAEAYRAGVPIVAGTDTPSLLMFPGYSLHDELELMVRDVGMTPLDALRAATITAARALRLASTTGSIAVGKTADLVLLSANPLEDIRNTRRIVAVIAGGRIAVTPGESDRSRASRPGPAIRAARPSSRATQSRRRPRRRS